ncbi:hypothetical protein BaRGS_00006180 [Batillaria attramentaria]|uniref:Uncharacterized protein n=1 Tax=Batillaria attramentaria TaxID=370345 RepID=A0ABD0LTE6_9CAEN
MTSPKLLTSLALALTVLTSLADGACVQKPLTIDRSAGLTMDGASMSVFCEYGEDQKPLFTAWVDVEACVRCLFSALGQLLDVGGGYDVMDLAGETQRVR